MAGDFGGGERRGSVAPEGVPCVSRNGSGAAMETRTPQRVFRDGAMVGALELVTETDGNPTADKRHLDCEPPLVLGNSRVGRSQYTLIAESEPEPRPRGWPGLEVGMMRSLEGI